MALLTDGPTTIATTRDMVAALMRRFPKHVESIESWAPSFARTLGHLQPARLEAVFFQVVDLWEYREPPKPADFVKVLGASRPTDPRDKQTAAQWTGIIEKGKQRDELAKRLVAATRAKYALMIDKAAAKWGVQPAHVERIMFLRLGKPYGTPESGSLAHKAATDAIFGGKPTPEYIELDASDEAWAHRRHCATIYAQQDRESPVAVPWGQHTVNRRPHEDPDEERRRRDTIATAEREAERISAED